MNLNKAMIIGNLTREPEVKTTPSGQQVASFTIATNQVWNDQSGQKQEKVEYHNIVVWRRLAEICGQYLRKGSKVYIEGRLQTREWTGQDGVKRYRTEIIGENMIMLDKIASSSSNTRYDQPPMPSDEPVIDVNDSNPDEEEIKVENIPF